MKTLLTMIAMASMVVLISCNDPKPPPDETRAPKPDTTQVKELPKQ